MKVLDQDMLAVVADPDRRRLLELTWHKEVSVTDLSQHFDTTTGRVSQQLRVLREHNLVHVRRDGRRRYYRTNQEQLGPLARYLETMWSAQLDDLVEWAEARSGQRRSRKEV